MAIARPVRTESADYYFTYIDKVGEGDIVDILRRQESEFGTRLQGISDDQSLHRYEAGKWSIREVMAHVNDTERLFVFRALWFARGLDLPLPSFDQDVALLAAAADARSWKSHVDEFASIRAATVAFFAHLPEDAWGRRGTASGNPFTVRALAYICAGHVAHHAGLLRERYLTA